MNKKIMFLILILFLSITNVYAKENVSICLAANNDVKNQEMEIRIKSILLSKRSVSLKEGETFQLRTNIMPNNANEELLWESSDSTIASVENGKIIAKRKGDVIITAYSKSEAVKATCNVKVLENVVIAENALRSISLDKKAISLKVNESEILTPILTPENAIDKLKWESNNDNVIVENGKVTAKKKGSSIVTVSNLDGKIKATCSIVVIDDNPTKAVKDLEIKEIVLEKTSLKLYKGNSRTLHYSVFPPEARNKKVIWSSSDENIVTVEDGLIIAQNKGTATITISNLEKDVVSTCEITVIDDETNDEESENKKNLIIVISTIVVIIGLIILLCKCINNEKK